jgi:hypothetical protein
MGDRSFYAKLLGLIAAAGVVLAVAWFWRQESRSASLAGGRIDPPQQRGTAASAPRSGAPALSPAAPSSRSRAESRARRDALRTQIVRALEGQPRAPEPPSPSVASASKSAVLKNRLGAERQPLVDYINEDFVPLASECIDQAEQRNPQLTGMLAIGLEIVADEALGGVIDRAEPAARNQVRDEELIECVRQSALTVVLPAPLITGRESIEITLRLGTWDAGQRESGSP